MVAGHEDQWGKGNSSIADIVVKKCQKERMRAPGTKMSTMGTG